MIPHVVSYTRRAEPEAAKTQLILVVRASVFSVLHRCLTDSAPDAMLGNGMQIDVRASGALLPQIREWLCEEPMLVDQGASALGGWLLHVAGPPVILFGADIPDLLAARLRAAASVLQDVPTVIDPAEDGGSHLFGSRRPMPPLFRTMP